MLLQALTLQVIVAQGGRRFSVETGKAQSQKKA